MGRDVIRGIVLRPIYLRTQGRTGIATIVGRPGQNQIGNIATRSPSTTPREVFNTIMSSTVQFSAFTRLLTHNNRVHDMEGMLRQMWVPSDWEASGVDNGDSWIPNPFAELQDDLDREARACLVSCWAALPAQREDDDLIA